MLAVDTRRHGVLSFAEPRLLVLSFGLVLALAAPPTDLRVSTAKDLASVTSFALPLDGPALAGRFGAVAQPFADVGMAAPHRARPFDAALPGIGHAAAPLVRASDDRRDASLCAIDSGFDSSGRGQDPATPERHKKHGRSRTMARLLEDRLPAFQLQQHEATDEAAEPSTDSALLEQPDLSGLSARAGSDISLSNAAEKTMAENRRAAALGIAADTMRFDDRPGRLSTAAEAGFWKGQPAAALGVGYTLPVGWARLNATGVTSGQKTFGLSAVASIALE